MCASFMDRFVPLYSKESSATLYVNINAPYVLILEARVFHMKQVLLLFLCFQHILRGESLKFSRYYK